MSDLMDILNRELSKPLPGRVGRVDEQTVEDEMRQFEKAKAAFQGG